MITPAPAPTPAFGDAGRPPERPARLARFREPRQRFAAELLTLTADIACRRQALDASGTLVPADVADTVHVVGASDADIVTGTDGVIEGSGCGPRERLRTASTLATAAAEAMRDHRTEAAWALLLTARRHLVPVLTEDEAVALAVVVHREADAKLTGWRRTAAADLLTSPIDRTRLAAALQLLDDAHTASFRRLRARRIELVVLTAWLTLALAGALQLVTPGGQLGEAPTFAMAILLGIVGAALSAIQRLARRPTKRVPDERAAGVASFLRPLSGAATALVVLAVADVGLVEDSGVLLAAFASGFSERYILRFVGRDDDGDDRAPGKPDPGDR